MRTFKLKIPTSASAIRFLGAELKQTADETRLLELVLRGYNLSSVLRDNDEKPTAEIIKIG